LRRGKVTLHPWRKLDYNPPVSAAQSRGKD
jgi:hypothetical protein